MLKVPFVELLIAGLGCLIVVICNLGFFLCFVTELLNFT